MQSLPRILFAALLSASLVAQDKQLAPVRDAVAEMVHQLQLTGAGLVAMTVDGEVHRSLHGSLKADAPMPIASASKWLACATILTLVDDGTLDLDSPVAYYLKEFDRDDKRRLTLRQCLACTGGVPARLPERTAGMDMAKFAAEAADTALREQPGQAFRYGGVGFQIVAAAARGSPARPGTSCSARASRHRWAWRTRSSARCSRSAVNLAPPRCHGSPAVRCRPSTTTRCSCAACSTKGNTAASASWRQPALPRCSATRCRASSKCTPSASMRRTCATASAPGSRACRQAACGSPIPGAFGFTPWIDLDLGVGGVFAVVDRVQRVLPHLASVQDKVRAAAKSPLVAGDEREVLLRHGGRDRRYLLHVPRRDDKAPLPLLLVLHGGGGTAEQARESTNLAEIGVRGGFVVAFADGTGPGRGRLLTWNSGGIRVWAAENDIDDTGFLRAVVADVQRQASIDPQRVFAVGHSNGGMMCHRLAREAADVFAGIAVVGGAMNFTAVDATSPIAVMLVHGTADENVRYEGGAPKPTMTRAGDRVDASVQAAVDYYLARNQLKGYPQQKREGKVRIDDYREGKAAGAVAAVRVITLEGGGHAWPGANTKPRAVADTPFPFAASQAIVNFFRDLTPLRPPAAAPR